MNETFYIFKKDGSKIVIGGTTANPVYLSVRQLQYDGTFLGQSHVSFTLKVPKPIDFEGQEYILLDGEKYTLKYIPSFNKQAESLKYGEAFVYDNIIMQSQIDDTTRVDFLDYVMEDNTIHYSSMPTVYFYGTVKDLAMRIQANLDRVFTGTEKWTVSTPTDGSLPTVEKNITYQNKKVWDVITDIWNQYKVMFYSKGRTLYIGYSADEITHNFQYGIGKGLKSLKRNTDENNEIITRLHAYGSKVNLPYRYYNKNTTVSESMYLPNLMLPAIRTDGNFTKYYDAAFNEITDSTKAVYRMVKTGYNSKALDICLESVNGIETYGILEGNITFDNNSDANIIDLVDDENGIYPTLTKMTNSEGGDACKIISATQLTDNGILNDSGSIDIQTFEIVVNPGFNPNDFVIAGETAQISLKSGMCQGRSFDFNCSKNDDGTYTLTCNRVIDGDFAFPNSDYNIQAGDTFVFLGIQLPDAYIQSAENRLLVSGLKYLAKFDHTKNTYTPELDNIFLNNNQDIAKKFSIGSIFMFTDSDVNGIDSDNDAILVSLPISQLTIKIGDSDIREYSITLADSPDISSSSVQRALSAVQNYNSSNNSSGSGTGSISDWVKTASKTFLRKDIDDTAHGIISFDKAIKSTVFIDGWDGKGWQVNADGSATFESLKVRSDVFLQGKIGTPNFVSGFTGSGWQIDGADARATFDYTTVRKSMKVYELVYSQIYGLGGSVMVTDLNKIKTVTALGSKSYTCTIDSMDNVMRMNLRNGDIVRMQRSEGINIRYFYGRVSNITSTTFDLTIIDGEDTPQAGDVVFRMGNVSDKTRQGILYLTSSDDYSPYLDVLDGITDASFSGKTKVRLGNLQGITVNGYALSGYGIYINGGIYQNCTYYLSDGTTVEQKFEVMNGLINSEISTLKNDMSLEPGNILKNSAFGRDTNYWNTTGTVHFINVAGSYLYESGYFYVEKDAIADIYTDGSRNVLRILNNNISQLNAVMSIPTHSSDETQTTYTYSFALYYKVLRAGTLTVGFSGTDLYISEALEVTNEYKKLSKVAQWNETGNFTLSFTGEILIYGVSLMQDALADATIHYNAKLTATVESLTSEYQKYYTDQFGAVQKSWTSQFNQQADKISANVKSIDSINSTISEAGWITKDTGNTIWAKKSMEDGTTIVSTINQTAKDVTIQATFISLEGLVTANNYFKILTDGSMEAVNGKFSGQITANSGSIAGFTIDSTHLYNTDFTSYIQIRDQYRWVQVGGTNKGLIEISNYRQGKSALRIYSRPTIIISGDTETTTFAIASSGGHALIQNSNDYWTSPGLLYSGIFNGTSTITQYWAAYGITVSISHVTDGSNTQRWRVTHNLGHTNYLPLLTSYVSTATSTQADNQAYPVVTNISSSYFEFTMKNADNRTELASQPAIVCIFGRNIDPGSLFDGMGLYGTI
jgi:hypothetical protein